MDNIRYTPKEIQQITEAQLRFHENLEFLEMQFDIDLTESKEIEIEKFIEVQQLGNLAVDWITKKGYISDEEAEELRNTVGNFVVMTQDDRREMLIASTAKGIQARDRLWEELRSYSEEEIAAFGIQYTQDDHETIQQHNKRILEDYQSPDFVIPPATYLGTVTENGIVQFASFCDWDVKDEVYTQLPFEGVVFEEVFHAASNLPVYDRKSPKRSSAAEEIAVYYYVVEALAELDIQQEYMSEFTAQDHEIVGWEGLVARIGPEKAANIYFRGQVDDEDINQYNAYYSEDLFK